MARVGPTAQDGETEPIRRMAARYLNARELRLYAMSPYLQEEVVAAMQEALQELRTYLLQNSKSCPESISRIIDDYNKL